MDFEISARISRASDKQEDNITFHATCEGFVVPEPGVDGRDVLAGCLREER